MGTKSLDASIDLLQKSEMKVCNGGEEVESQAKSLSAIAVSILEDAKPIEIAQSVFDHDAARS